MSMTTTSASCLSAMPRAAVAPTLPAPPTTVTFRFIAGSSSHVLDNRVAEFRGLQLRRAVHEPREVVGHAFGGNGTVHALDDQIGGLGPPHVPHHHLAREDDRAGIH